MPFIETYESGIATPNPDVDCNSQIKFNRFRDHVLNDMGFDYMATGHYARTSPNFLEMQDSSPPQSISLLRGVDPVKDQTYFLSTTPVTIFRVSLTSCQGHFFHRVLFPVGSLLKSQVKDIASSAAEFSSPSLRILSKRESMGVCFIGKRKMNEFLPNYFPPTPGSFIDIDTQKVVGFHNGAEILTRGQGAKIGGKEEKYYVVKKIRNSGDVLVGKGKDHPGLFCQALDIDWSRFNWISGSPPVSPSQLLPFDCHFQCRHQQKAIPCRVTLTNLNSASNGQQVASPLPLSQTSSTQISSSPTLIHLEPLAPLRAPMSGQIVVLYQGDVCLGGGPIRHTYSNYFN
jgi:tRNA U34 2-thiouridine synthase MnmA/TrmU